MFDMRRREFIALLGGAAAAWPLAARAQQAKRPVIGFLSSGSPRAFAGFVEAFRQGLTDQGFVEGQNVLIDYRWAEGRYHELDPLAADLVRRQVDVLAATGGLVSAHAAKRATTTIPVLFVAGYDPVKIGLVTSVSRPEGNLTGVSIITTELAAKRLELLTELVPGTRSLAILVNPQGITTDIETNDTMAAAQDLKQTLLVFKASNDREIEAAFASAVLQQARALLVSADPLFTSRRAQIVALAARNKLAASYPFRNYVEGGGLMSYGTELAWAYRHVGDYAGRIIKGADPRNLPVVMPTRFQLVINLKTAKALELEVPATVLARADDVIE